MLSLSKQAQNSCFRISGQAGECWSLTAILTETSPRTLTFPFLPELKTIGSCDERLSDFQKVTLKFYG
jgi:hypothetical protein